MSPKNDYPYHKGRQKGPQDVGNLQIWWWPTMYTMAPVAPEGSLAGVPGGLPRHLGRGRLPVLAGCCFLLPGAP